MKLIYKMLLGAQLLLFSVVAYSQQASTVAQRVQAVLAPEEVKVWHSQPLYAAGERIWYNAFVNGSIAGKESKILHVALLDATGKSIAQQQLILQGKRAHADIALPQDLPTGCYTLKASTNWMKNYSSGQHFSEQILVMNPKEVADLSKPRFSERMKLQAKFIPEGHSFIVGASANIAVVFTDAAGMGVVGKGVVKDTAGTVVTTFVTDSLGLGKFTLKAAEGVRYEASIVSGLDTVQQALPIPKVKGRQLSITELSSNGLSVRISNSTEEPTALVAISQGEVYFTHTAAQPTAEETIQVPSLPAAKGEIIKLLLLNGRGAVEAERQVANPSYKLSLAQLSTDKLAYSPREKVTVSLQNLTGLEQIAVTVNEKQSVLRSTAFKDQANNRSDMFYMAQPADTELWMHIQLNDFTARFQPEIAVRTLAVQPELNQEPYSTATDTAFLKALPPQVIAYAQNHYKLTEIEEVYGITEPHAAAELPKLEVDKVFRLDDFVAFNNVKEAIKEATTNVKLKRKAGQYSANILYTDKNTKRLLKQEPLYLLDGVVLESMSTIIELNINDIESFEVAWSNEMLGKSNLGQRAENGIFAVYTKSREVSNKLREQGNPVLYGHYTIPKNFVTTTYTGHAAILENMPDLKNMLFWNTAVEVDANGKASFSFYTSDNTGTFQIKVNGITKDGTPVEGTTEFKVMLAN